METVAANSDTSSAEGSAEAADYLTSFLNKTMHVHIADGRMFVGQLKCTDNERNIILAMTQEYRQPCEAEIKLAAQQHERAGRTGNFKVDMKKRFVGLVVVPGQYVTKVETRRACNRIDQQVEDTVSFPGYEIEEEYLSTGSKGPNYTEALWRAVFLAKSVNWVKKSEAIPSTPLWDAWLAKAGEVAKEASAAYQQNANAESQPVPERVLRSNTWGLKSTSSRIVHQVPEWDPRAYWKHLAEHGYI